MTGNDAEAGWVISDDEPDLARRLTEDRQLQAAEERRLAAVRAANADWGPVTVATED
jgi:hypothetical protein